MKIIRKGIVVEFTSEEICQIQNITGMLDDILISCGYNDCTINNLPKELKNMFITRSFLNKIIFDEFFEYEGETIECS